MHPKPGEWSCHPEIPEGHTDASEVACNQQYRTDLGGLTIYELTILMELATATKVPPAGTLAQLKPTILDPEELGSKSPDGPSRDTLTLWVVI